MHLVGKWKKTTKKEGARVTKMRRNLKKVSFHDEPNFPQVEKNPQERSEMAKALGRLIFQNYYYYYYKL